MFKEHMKNVYNKKRLDFRELLEENRGLINPFSSWESVVEMIKEEKRF